MKKISKKERDGALRLARQAKVEQELIADNVKDSMKRILEHRNFPADVLFVGEKITEFKQTDLFIIIQTAVEYVVNSVLNNIEVPKKDINSDLALGIQVGAKRVLSTIQGLETQSIIMNNQADQRKKLEEQDKIDNGEDDLPATKNQGDVSI